MIFISKRVEANSWVSFESDPHLRITKKRIYERCVPCLSGLLHDLKTSPEKVVLTYALNCWKLSVILPTHEDCLHFLMVFSELWPDEYVYGKFGTGDPHKPTKVVVFHVDDDVTKLNELQLKVKLCTERLNCPFDIKITKGCSFPFEVLFGPWESWKREMEVLNKENLQWVVDKLKKMLYLGHGHSGSSYG